MSRPLRLVEPDPRLSEDEDDVLARLMVEMDRVADHPSLSQEWRASLWTSRNHLAEYLDIDLAVSRSRKPDASKPLLSKPYGPGLTDRGRSPVMFRALCGIRAGNRPRPPYCRR
jgi:hypothetical protein